MKEDAVKLLRELADKLGTTTEYLWGVLVNQGPISGAFAIITFLLLLCLSIAFTFFAKKVIESKSEDGWMLLLSVIAIAFILVTIIYGTNALRDGIYGILNPEYWALLQLLNIK